jgi:hypothetical protein
LNSFKFRHLVNLTCGSCSDTSNLEIVKSIELTDHAFMVNLIERQMGTDRQTETQKERDRQIGSQTDTDRHTDRQTNKATNLML